MAQSRDQGSFPMKTPNWASMKCLNDMSDHSRRVSMAPNKAKTFEKYEIVVPNSELTSEVKTIQWRSKTQFPVVKVLFYKKITQKQTVDGTAIEMAIESFSCTLAELPTMNLNQLLYPLKQTLIGFQRLYDRFGSFDISPTMIMINKKRKCRVWMHERVEINEPRKSNKSSQSEFKNSILNLFKIRVVQCQATKELFGILKSTNKIEQAVSLIESYALDLGLNIPDCVSTMPGQGLKREQKEAVSTSQINIFGSLSKKVPKFVQQLKIKPKRSPQAVGKSFDDVRTPKTPTAPRQNLAPPTFFKPRKDSKQEQKSSNSPISPPSRLSYDLKLDNYPTSASYLPSQQPQEKEKMLAKQKSQQNLSVINSKSKGFLSMMTNKDFKGIDKSLTRTPVGSPNCQKSFKPQKSNVSVIDMKEAEWDPSKFYKPMPGATNAPAQIAKEDKDKKRTSNMWKNRKSSNQEATTLMVKKEQAKPQQVKSLTSLPCEKSQQPDQELFAKNGWMKRLNSLTNQNIRDTLQSECEGNDVFSAELNLAGFDLELLGKMGKELRGTIAGMEER